MPIRWGGRIRAVLVLATVAALSLRVVALASAATPPPLVSLDECDGCVTVIDVPAWDEQKTIIDQPAWDEPITIHTPDWTELKQIDVPAVYVPAVPATQVWITSGYTSHDWVVSYITDYQWVDTSSWQPYWVDTSYWQPYEYWQSAWCWDGDGYFDCGYWVSGSQYVSSGYTAYAWVPSGYEQPVRIDTSHYVDTWHDTSHYETVPGQDAYWIPAHTETQSIFHPAATSIVYVHHDAVTHIETTHHIAIGHLQRIAAGGSVSVQGAPPASGGSGTTGAIVTEPVQIPIVTTLTLIDQPAHTQIVTVVDQPAYDVVSTVVDQPAYDELVTVVDQPATTVTTTVIDAPAYTVAHHDLVTPATTATRQVLVTPGFYQNVSTLVPAHYEYGNHWVSSGYSLPYWVSSGYYQPVWVSSGYWAWQWVNSGYWGQQWVSSGYYTQLWQPDYWVPWHCWGYGEDRDCDGGYTQPGYWYTGWVDTSHYEPVWVDTSHYENYWVDTSGYQQQWVDTSHYESQWVDTSHTEYGQYTVGDTYITSPTYVNSGYQSWRCWGYGEDRDCDDVWNSTAYTAYPNQTYVPPVYTTVTDQIPAVYRDWTETIPAVTHTVTTTVPAVTHTAIVHHDAVTHTVTTHYAAVTHTESQAVAASTHDTTLAFNATVVPDSTGGSGDALGEFLALLGLVALSGGGRLSARNVLRQTVADWSNAGQTTSLATLCLATNDTEPDDQVSADLAATLGVTYASGSLAPVGGDGTDLADASLPADFDAAIAGLLASPLGSSGRGAWDEATEGGRALLQSLAYGLADQAAQTEAELNSTDAAAQARALAKIAIFSIAAGTIGWIGWRLINALRGLVGLARFMSRLATMVGGAATFVVSKLGGAWQWLRDQIGELAPAAARVGSWGPPKPTVVDGDLQNLVNQLYRQGATIGNGGTADAIRAGFGHVQKGQDYIPALMRWLQQHPDASADDIHAAQSMLQDLISALAGRGYPGP